MLLVVSGLLLVLISSGSCGKTMPALLVDKVEREVFHRIDHACDLIISRSALDHVDADVMESKPTFIMDLGRGDGIETLMAETIRSQSFCIILIALEAQSKEERMSMEMVVSLKVASFLVLLSTEQDQHPHRCSYNPWTSARRSFHLELYHPKVRM